MGTENPSFLENTIAAWLAEHQDDLRPLALSLSGVSGSSLLFQADSRRIHMSVPSLIVGSLDPPSSSEEVFVVTAPEDPHSDQRFNSALTGLNEKLERLRPDTPDALHVAMEYLVSTLKKHQGKRSRSSRSSTQQLTQYISNDTELDADDRDCGRDDDDDDDDDDECDSDEGSDNESCSSDEIDFGYGTAAFEDASGQNSSAMHSNGYLCTMVVDAKHRCDRARQKFSSGPPETVGRWAKKALENSILAWCSVELVPSHRLVRIKMQVGGIVSDGAAAASLGLSLDFPTCISLQFNEDHWCRKENDRPLKVDACYVKAMEPKVIKSTEEEEDAGFVKKDRFGEENLLPELIDYYFRFLENGCDRLVIVKGANALKDLKTHASNKNVFVGLICFLAARLKALPNWCVVCLNTLPYNVGRLRTCDRELCLYRFEELGLGTAVLYEVQKYPQHFDFEVSLAVAATSSTRDVFEPFPAFLLESSEIRGRSGWFSSKMTERNMPSKHLRNKKMNVLQSILDAYPSIDEMQSCSDEVELKKMLKTAWQNRPRQRVEDSWKEKLELPYDVLRFLLSTSRLTIYSLQEAEALSQFESTVYQFAVLHDNPEKEARFEKRRRKKGGSFFAFHGSATGNWYSILRNGLRSLSHTAYMSAGASFGGGIYIASNMSTSTGYLKEGIGWQHGKLYRSFSVLAICEIVTGSVLHPNRAIMVVPTCHEQDILIRYILVFPGGSNFAYVNREVFITSTLLQTHIDKKSTDLLDHHRRMRQVYHEKKQSEWTEARKVRWMSMKAMYA